jgi:hypothetical protein
MTPPAPNEKGARRAASLPTTGKNDRRRALAASGDRGSRFQSFGRILRPWHNAAEHLLEVHCTAKSGAEIRFEARPMKAGHNWMVVVTFPDRPEMHVNDFPTEADARNWITTNDSQEWLKKLGYGYE